MERLASIVIAIRQNPRKARDELRIMRRRAIRRGDSRMAAGCLKLLYMVSIVLSESLETRVRLVRRLVREEPSAANFVALATTEEMAGHAGAARAAFKRVTRFKSDVESVRLARAALTRLEESAGQ